MEQIISYIKIKFIIMIIYTLGLSKFKHLLVNSTKYLYAITLIYPKNDSRMPRLMYLRKL